MGAKVYFYVCVAICVGSSPAFAPPDRPTPITSRTQLSPLARMIDDTLFGDPLQLPYDVAVPFQPSWATINKAKLDAAFGEVAAFRGEALKKLFGEGVVAREKFRRQIIAGGHAGLGPYKDPYEVVGASWDFLRADQLAGTKPLSAEAIQQRALQRTQAQVPEAFSEADALKLSDPVARLVNRRHMARIELTETQPAKPQFSEAQFTSWKHEQLAWLAAQAQATQLQAIELAIRNQPGSVFLQRGDERVPLTWEEFRKIPLLPAFEVNRDKNGPPFLLRGSLQVADPELRQNLKVTFAGNAGAGGVQKLSHVGVYEFGSPFNGIPNLATAVHQQTQDLLKEKIAVLGGAVQMLQNFRHAAYLRDGGALFWRQFHAGAMISHSGFGHLYRSPRYFHHHFTPFVEEEGVSQLETALWGKIANDSKHYEKVQAEWKSQRGWLARLFPSRALPVKSALSSLSSTPPTAEEHRRAARAAWVSHSVRSLLPASVLVAGFALAGAAGRPDWVPSLGLGGSPSPISGDPGGGDATNKPPGGSAPLYSIEPTKEGEGKIPNRFALGRPKDATIEVPTVPTTDHVVSHYQMKSVGVGRGATALPTGDGATLFSLRLKKAKTGELIPNTEYQVRRTALGEYVVFPSWGTGDYKIEAGFGGREDRRPEVPSIAALRAIDPAELVSLAKDLEAKDFRLLPLLLRRIVSVAESTGTPITAYDLEQVLEKSALYSTRPERRQWFPMFRSELDRASRFLNPDGIACNQCDGARESGVSIFRRVLQNQKEVTVTPRTVLVPTDNPLVLTEGGRHADFVVTSKQGSNVVFDTTPKTVDPLSGEISSPVAPLAARGRGVELPNVPGGTEAPALPNVPKPSSPSPWDDVLAQLVQDWNQGEETKHYAAWRQQNPVAMGPLDPWRSAPEISTEWLFTTVDSAHADELEAGWEEVKKLLVAANADVTGSRLPPVVLRDVTKITQAYLRGAIDFEQAKARLRSYVPADFRWVGAYPQNQLHRAIVAIADRQNRFYQELRRKFRAGDLVAKDIAEKNPWALNGKIEQATAIAFQELTAKPLEAPSNSARILAFARRTGCAGTSAALGETP